MRRGGNRGFERRPPYRDPGRRVIIVCEGSKTEPQYFDAIRKELRLPTVQVIVTKASGTDPRNVVDDAIAKRKELIDDQRWNAERDTIWAVYDGDEHITHNKRNWDEALDIARRKKVNLAISNPCFE